MLTRKCTESKGMRKGYMMCQADTQNTKVIEAQSLL